ncbi:MAG: fatty acid desaturase [Pirellulaceae bacterium]|nr:fatty acid desaturase [Pirellulaceae bacterium]
MSAPAAAAPQFSLTEARGIVRDLFAPKEWIYWVDFLVTIFLGHILYGVTRSLWDNREQIAAAGWAEWQRLGLQAITFLVTCLLYYRAVMFVHEIVHLPEKKFRLFRVVWNCLCGIFFLTPTFTYYTHLDHHRRKMFGTKDDGEYLPLARMSPWYILFYLTQALWVPPLAVIRFGLLTPLTWFIPPLRRLVHQRASSLVMDPMYLRPLPTSRTLFYIRLQELGCFLFIVAIPIVSWVKFGRWPYPFIVQAYATGVVLVFLNAVRTLAAHRWWSDGHEGAFLDQMLDSVTMDNDSVPAVLINPVGLRYHATHHLFPSMPYHNIRAAHKRLMEQLPADSPYRQTVGRSVLGSIADLWRRAAAYQRQKSLPQSGSSGDLKTARAV